MSERMYVYVVWDKHFGNIAGIFRKREEAEAYAKQYCTSFEIRYEVVV